MYTPHESSVPGPLGTDDSLTALELTTTRSGRTMTAAHAASLILNKCFKVQTPGARNVDPGQAVERKGTFRPLPECSRVREEGGGQVRLSLRTPPPSHPRHARGRRPQGARKAHRWVPARFCLLPLPPLAAGRRSLANAPPARPFPLRDILYNNPSESKRKRRTLPGPVPWPGPDACSPSPRPPH